MTKTILILTLSLLSLVAIAKDKNKKLNPEVKAHMSSHINKKISLLNQHQSCVNSASDRSALKDCRAKHKDAQKQLRAEGKAGRKKLKAKRKERRAQRKANRDNSDD